MNYDDWKTESPEDEQCRLDRMSRRMRGHGGFAPDDDSPEAAAYWEYIDRKIDEARES
jgi:hypothetical protein